MCAHIIGVADDFAEALLDPPTFGLQRELRGVAVRQRGVDAIEARSAGPVLGQSEQLGYVVPQRHDPRLSDGIESRGMGRTAHLRMGIGPSRLTFAVSLEKWK